MTTIERTFVFSFPVHVTVEDDPDQEPEVIETARLKLLDELPRRLDNGNYEIHEETF